MSLVIQILAKPVVSIGHANLFHSLALVVFDKLKSLLIDFFKCFHVEVNVCGSDDAGFRDLLPETLVQNSGCRRGSREWKPTIFVHYSVNGLANLDDHCSAHNSR